MSIELKQLSWHPKKLKNILMHCQCFAGIIIGISKSRSENKNNASIISDIEMDHIKKKDKILIEAQEAKSYAISRFRLLGADGVVAAISETTMPAYDFRNIIIFDKRFPTPEELEEIRKKITSIRREVQTKTSQYYKTLCP